MHKDCILRGGGYIQLYNMKTIKATKSTDTTLDNIEKSKEAIKLPDKIEDLCIKADKDEEEL